MAAPSNRRALRSVLLALVLGAQAGTAGQAAKVPSVATEARLPPVVIADLGGRRSTTEHLRGRVVVLNVWATWCGPCRRELPSLDALHRSLDPERFVVAGVSVDDDPTAVREFLAQHRIAFPNFVAADRAELVSALGLRSVPETFVVAADGVIVERYSGPRDWNAAVIRAAVEAAWANDRRGGRPVPSTALADGGRGERP